MDPGPEPARSEPSAYFRLLRVKLFWSWSSRARWNRPDAGTPGSAEAFPGVPALAGVRSQIRWHFPEGVPWLTSLFPVPRDPRPGVPA